MLSFRIYVQRRFCRLAEHKWNLGPRWQGGRRLIDLVRVSVFEVALLNFQFQDIFGCQLVRIPQIVLVRGIIAAFSTCFFLHNSNRVKACSPAALISHGLYSFQSYVSEFAMLKKNTRFLSLILLALFVCLVSFVDSALAGKSDSGDPVTDYYKFVILSNPNR